MKFKEAQLEDVHQIEKLVNSAYRGESSKLGWTTEADLLGGVRIQGHKLEELITSPDSKIITCVGNDETILGCVNLISNTTTLYLGMLTVNPTLQNSGIGKKILEYVDHYARSNNFEEIEMTVISKREELIAWYERKGFSRTGEKRPFPMNDPTFGIPKTDLEFVVLTKKHK